MTIRMTLDINHIIYNSSTMTLKPFLLLYLTANFSDSAKFIGISSLYLSWTDAQAYCRTHHTDLASALNSSDNNFLFQLRNIQGDSWIGLYRDTWKWSDGTVATNLPWASGEPNNYLVKENCASHISKLFNDYLCETPAYFYCHTSEFPPVREQQIVRLRVKSDGSVLDPAVQSYILEQVSCRTDKISPTGLTPVVISRLITVRHNYHLIKQTYTWPVAQNYCRVMYTDMATIITDDDWLRLNKEAMSKGFTAYTWIGLYDDVDSWRWSLNELPLKDVTYTNWYSGQPDNYAGKEACAVIYIYGTWADTICTGLRPFICYNANFSDSAKFIGISSLYLSWTDAQAYCRTHHTDLASALNSSDNNFLFQLRNIQGDSWIGLYRDTWKWSDGTVATNLPWYPGEPNNYYVNEKCVSHINKLFNDYLCETPAYFYCHTIPPVREQQIVRLRVKSDGSVLDPAVQSYILEQMKQKLKEKGMLENTTVTWRVQPDGNIFHKINKDDL
ncbi:hypothetical protein QTP70_032244 [Hemibagrus guttatus]|uniref:C-type lectin domain-containing protein n=1 Tax=Hemibagrus guttatus TaxID=175788 RepID=A0AAE0UJC4_9TELE|nr:hypothetical protein QTP70_032244 [Hemibagrus guttatus]